MKSDTFKKNDDYASLTIDAPPTIPLSVAIERATSWRDMLSSLPPASSTKTVPACGMSGTPTSLMPEQLIFRAINIRMSDILWLIAQHPDASSVRLYMSLPDADSPYQICGMLVPVDAQNQDMLTLASDGTISRDDMMNSTAASTVYDFTQPCPTTCNAQSPLYNADNSPDPYFRYKK